MQEKRENERGAPPSYPLKDKKKGLLRCFFLFVSSLHLITWVWYRHEEQKMSQNNETTVVLWS